MPYVDGFLAAVPLDKKDAFLAHATIARDVFRENGALNVVECWAEDVPEGKLTSMPMAVTEISRMATPGRMAHGNGWPTGGFASCHRTRAARAIAGPWARKRPTVHFPQPAMRAAK